MRWFRFLRRRKPPAWINHPAPTFHHEEHDGVVVPVPNDPAALTVETGPRPDLRVIQCNYAAATKTCPEAARAYVLWMNNGNGHDRIEVLARSRGGRFIRKYEDVRHLVGFRVKTIPPEHPLYDRLARDAYDYELEEAVARLRDAREYWSTHTVTGGPRAVEAWRTDDSDS